MVLKVCKAIISTQGAFIVIYTIILHVFFHIFEFKYYCPSSQTTVCSLIFIYRFILGY